MNRGVKRLNSAYEFAELHSFHVFGEAEAAGRSTVIDAYLEYWSKRRRDGDLPHRADIRPEDLRGLVRHAVILDVLRAIGSDRPFRLHTRLIGTQVTDHYGEITGKDIAEMTNKAAADRIYRMCGLAIERREAMLSVVEGISPEQAHISANALYMPLAGEDGSVEKILVCVETHYL